MAPDSSRFGRYEVEEEVARGGMGVIYRVRDPQMRRFLAMKVLLTDVGESRAGSGSMQSNLSARFADEAQLTGQLDHPGIIPVYDMGEDEAGRLFFTMRLVKGRTLEEIIESVRKGEDGWTVTRVLGILQKVCEAMGFAHDRGVVHRDLKPANVMVGRFGETYVMDWGLAKLISDGEEPPSSEESDLQTVLTSGRSDESGQGSDLATLDGDVMGTPAYMSPEQARGELDRVGPRSDVYAVGAMLYHLLSGDPPFRPAGESVPPVEILKSLLKGPPPAIESLAPGVAPELCAICDHAMAREPEQRYGTMLEMAEDLQAYVEDRVVHAYRSGALVEFRKWIRRNRGIAASLAALIVLVVAGLAWVSYVQTQARAEVEKKNRELAATNLELETAQQRTADARDRAERNRKRAERNRELALESEQDALASEKEALWQSYVGNIGAAYAALEVGSASEARRRLAACPESHRSWEWHYLDQRSDGSLRVLTGSEAFVRTLAIHPVESQVAAAGGVDGDSGIPDFAIRIWDYRTGESVQELRGHRDSVASLAYSPSGDILASADVSGDVRLWDLASGELAMQFNEGCSRIAYHPDGRFIALARFNSGYVALWDSYDLEIVKEQGLPVGTNDLEFSPDGQRIAFAGRDNRVRILDLELEPVLDLTVSSTSREARTSSLFKRVIGAGARSVEFSPDGRFLASGSEDGYVRTWSLETGEPELLLGGHASGVLSVSWHPRFDWIVSSDESGTIRFWNSVSGQALDVLRGHDEKVHDLEFSPLGDRMVSASRDRTLRVWDGQAGAIDTILEGLSVPNFRPYKLAFSPDGERIVWRRDTQSLVTTDVRTGEDLASRWTANTFSLLALAFTDEGVWECEDSGNVMRWDPETGDQLALLEADQFPVRGSFQRDGSLVGVAGYPRNGNPAMAAPELSILDLDSGATRWTTELPMIPQGISHSPDGTRCLVVGRSRLDQDSVIACVNTETGTILWQVGGIPGLLEAVYLPSGKELVHTTYNGWEKALFIRDAETGELLRRFKGHAQPASIAVSPDGARIVTGNWDGTLSLWSPDRGEILALPAHKGVTMGIAYSPDGRTIASLGDDGRRRLWSAGPVELRQEARNAAARRRRWSVDARRRVEGLLATRVHPAAVVDALEADSTLRPEQRQAAILWARTGASSAEKIIERAFLVCLDPGRKGADYMAALEGALVVSARIPSYEGIPVSVSEKIGAEIASVHCATGFAQIRLGLTREALVSLDAAAKVNVQEEATVASIVELLRSLAYVDLGELENASAAYERSSRPAPGGQSTSRLAGSALGSALEAEVRRRLGIE